jgi:hypothetical protein
VATYEELAAREAAVRKLLHDGAEARLLAIANVKHVSLGAKQIGGRPTDDLCIRVYVDKKVPLHLLPPDQRIPREIDGVPTDVNVIRTARFLADLVRYRPIHGGISISNQIIFTDSNNLAAITAGTFGCTATRRSNKKNVLLTNWHIAVGDYGGNGKYIFQPATPPDPNLPPPPNPIYPQKNDDMIATVVDSRINATVDAAIAELDVSSCCRCCGLDFDDGVPGLTDENVLTNQPYLPGNKIINMRPPVTGKLLYKVGISTFTTEGKLLDANTPTVGPIPRGKKSYTFTNQISIASNNPNIPFSSEGDSGSVIIDEDNYIVGLLFASSSDEDDVFHVNDTTYANQIKDVCDTLKIDINFSKTKTGAGARVALPPRVTFDHYLSREGNELYARAREQLLADPAGAWLFALGEQHREELVTLVTSRRPVTVVWHRLGGPAVFAAGIKNLRSGTDALPAPAEGTLEDALSKLGDVLAAHGSQELRDAIATHREVLLAAAHDSASVADVLAKLNAALPAALIAAAP